MLCSAEYVGINKRHHQSAWQKWLPSQTQMDPEAGWNTAFEQLGSASDWKLHLVESIYQRYISIGQSRLQPSTGKLVITEIKEDFVEHIRSYRAPQAPTRDQGKVCSTAQSSARAPWRTEGATAQGPGWSQSQGWRSLSRRWQSTSHRHRSESCRPCSSSPRYCSRSWKQREHEECTPSHGNADWGNEHTTDPGQKRGQGSREYHKQVQIQDPEGGWPVPNSLPGCPAGLVLGGERDPKIQISLLKGSEEADGLMASSSL